MLTEPITDADLIRSIARQVERYNAVYPISIDKDSLPQLLAIAARLDAPARVPPSSPSGPDHRIIDAVSVALGGQIGRDDDVDRLRAQLKPTDGDHARVACEIAVAFIRWAQEQKATISALRGENERLKELLGMGLAIPHAVYMRELEDRRGNESERDRWENSYITPFMNRVADVLHPSAALTAAPKGEGE